jgi:GNAT superfamily N-acetyltransferase
MIRIRPTDDEAEIGDFDRECFDPTENGPIHFDLSPDMWLASDGEERLGYAVATEYPPGALMFERYGVAETHRGRGLGRRLTRHVARWAARNRWHSVWTYTHPTNAVSGNVLAACGFKMWRPAPAFFGYRVGSPEAEAMSRYVYWRRDL